VAYLEAAEETQTDTITSRDDHQKSERGSMTSENIRSGEAVSEHGFGGETATSGGEAKQGLFWLLQVYMRFVVSLTAVLTQMVSVAPPLRLTKGMQRRAEGSKVMVVVLGLGLKLQKRSLSECEFGSNSLMHLVRRPKQPSSICPSEAAVRNHIEAGSGSAASASGSFRRGLRSSSTVIPSLSLVIPMTGGSPFLTNS